MVGQIYEQICKLNAPSKENMHVKLLRTRGLWILISRYFGLIFDCMMHNCIKTNHLTTLRLGLGCSRQTLKPRHCINLLLECGFGATCYGQKNPNLAKTEGAWVELERDEQQPPKLRRNSFQIEQTCLKISF